MKNFSQSIRKDNSSVIFFQGDENIVELNPDEQHERVNGLLILMAFLLVLNTMVLFLAIILKSDINQTSQRLLYKHRKQIIGKYYRMKNNDATQVVLMSFVFLIGPK